MKLADERWTLVQHSAYGYQAKPGWDKAVETRSHHHDRGVGSGPERQRLRLRELRRGRRPGDEVQLPEGRRGRSADVPGSATGTFSDKDDRRAEDLHPAVAANVIG